MPNSEPSVNCPRCEALLVCGACGAAIEALPTPPATVVPHTGADVSPRSQAEADQRYLVVAKGHQDLLSELRRVVGEFGWVRIIEDRRDDPTLLPRSGREGPVHVEGDIEP